MSGLEFQQLCLHPEDVSQLSDEQIDVRLFDRQWGQEANDACIRAVCEDAPLLQFIHNTLCIVVQINANHAAETADFFDVLRHFFPKIIRLVNQIAANRSGILHEAILHNFIERRNACSTRDRITAERRPVVPV
jgi:hypothetical protein